MCKAPLDVYQTLHAKEFFLTLANFYISWADEMEKTKNYKRTNAIYVEGIEKRAAPLSKLENAFR